MRVTVGYSGFFVCFLVVFVYRLWSANELPFFVDAIPWVLVDPQLVNRPHIAERTAMNPAVQ